MIILVEILDLGLAIGGMYEKALNENGHSRIIDREWAERCMISNHLNHIRDVILNI